MAVATVRRSRTPVAPPPAPADPVTAYALAVTAGEIVAGKLVRMACERHLRDLEDGPARGLVFDVSAAMASIRFFGLLPHIKGEWAKSHGVAAATGAGRLVLRGWQEFIVGSLFGWKWAATGLRRFRTAYIEVARKNGKSTTAAGVGLYTAFFDSEPGAEVYAAATTRKQARIVWEDAYAMVSRTPALRQRITPLAHNLHSTATASKFEPVSSEAGLLDGLNIHAAIVDELHAHPNRNLVDVLTTATGARRQPLMFFVTTAGHNRLSVCWQHREYSVRVMEGQVEDDTWFAFVATIDEGDDWRDPAVWPKANPNLGVSVKLDDLMAKCKRAQEIPGEQNAFRQLHCNEWTEQSSRWIDMDIYSENDAHPVDPGDYAGRSCFGGTDLSTTTDLTAVVLLFPCAEVEGAVDVLARFWVPEEAIRRRSERDRAPYDVWARDGWLSATPGNVVDYTWLRRDISTLADLYDMQEMAYDPWNATGLVTQLQQDGMTLIPIRQGFGSLSAPSKALETLIAGRKFHHGGNPVLRWMFANVSVTRDPSGNIKPDKTAARERIDGVAATVTALARMIVADGDGASYYEHNPLFVL